MNRAELGASLRAWRERLQPQDVGMPVGTGRRTPGLRREEVATLAGISVDYLSRLEQGRGPHPSEAVLASLGRTLRVSERERDQMCHLAGVAPPHGGQIESAVRPSVLRMLDRFTDLPALLLDAKSDVLAWNALAAALLGDFSAWPPRQRNIVWQRFLGGDGRIVTTPAEAEQIGETMVGELRSVTTRYPDDPGAAALVAELRTGSAEFERLWQQRPAEAWRSANKRVRHPQLGVLDLTCDVLLVPDTDQRLIVYSADPGTTAADGLALLRVVGVQDVVSPTP